MSVVFKQRLFICFNKLIFFIVHHSIFFIYLIFPFSFPTPVPSLSLPSSGSSIEQQMKRSLYQFIFDNKETVLEGSCRKRSTNNKSNTSTQNKTQLHQELVESVHHSNELPFQHSSFSCPSCFRVVVVVEVGGRLDELTFQCTTCLQSFCSFCVNLDYSYQYDRYFCIDCNFNLKH